MATPDIRLRRGGRPINLRCAGAADASCTCCAVAARRTGARDEALDDIERGLFRSRAPRNRSGVTPAAPPKPPAALPDEPLRSCRRMAGVEEQSFSRPPASTVRTEASATQRTWISAGLTSPFRIVHMTGLRASPSLETLTSSSSSGPPSWAARIGTKVAVQDASAARTSQPGLGAEARPSMAAAMSVQSSPPGPAARQAAPSSRTGRHR